MSNKIIGEWKVLKDHGCKGGTRPVEVECLRCNRVFTRNLYQIRRHKYKMCVSCAVRAAKTVHGHCHSPVYSSWASAVARCRSPKSPSYSNYGGRGLTVCRRWQEFTAFHEDMGDRPEGLELDRINNDQGYTCGRCPECVAKGWGLNCRWTTRSVNQRNQRKRRGSKNPYKGAFRLASGKWMSKIFINYKQKYLGCYDTAEEAHEAYLKAVADLYQQEQK